MKAAEATKDQTAEQSRITEAAIITEAWSSHPRTCYPAIHPGACFSSFQTQSTRCGSVKVQGNPTILKCHQGPTTALVA